MRVSSDTLLSFILTQGVNGTVPDGLGNGVFTGKGTPQIRHSISIPSYLLQSWITTFRLSRITARNTSRLIQYIPFRSIRRRKEGKVSRTIHSIFRSLLKYRNGALLPGSRIQQVAVRVGSQHSGTIIRRPATARRIIDNDSPVIFGMKILRAFIYINRISSPPAIRIYPIAVPIHTPASKS